MERDESFWKRQSHRHTRTLRILGRTPALSNCLLRLFHAENHTAAPVFTAKIKILVY